MLLTPEKLGLCCAPVVAFWLLCAVFAIVGRTSAGRRAQLQPGGWSDPEKERASLAFVAFFVVTQQVTQIAMNVALEVLEGNAEQPVEPLPSWWVAVLQFFGMMCVIDSWQYWGHRLMHTNRWLYANVHSWHHRIHAPYSFSASFNHPIEGLLLDTASGAIALLVVSPHPYVSALAFTASLAKTVDDHCGMKLAWDPLQRVFTNNAEYHDLHHEPRGARFNFSQPWFSFWDDVCGTRMPAEMAQRTAAASSRPGNKLSD